MVYLLFNEQGELGLKTTSTTRSFGSRIKTKHKISRSEINCEGLWPNLVLHFFSALLFLYDLLTYPIYLSVKTFLCRHDGSSQSKSDQVDARTWIKMPVEPVKKVQFRGSTVSDIFASSVGEFKDNQCLGYRAVITCPMMQQNEQGQSVMREKSFRSDYTWYTYEQIGRRVQDIASGLYYYKVCPNTRCLFLANTCLEWFCASQACYQIGAQLVLAPEVIHISDLHNIVTESQVNLIFASCDRIIQVCALLDAMRNSNNPSRSYLSKLILIDWLFGIDFNEPLFAELRQSAIDIVQSDMILSLAQVEEIGVEFPIELKCTKPLYHDDDDPVTNPTESSPQPPHTPMLAEFKSPEQVGAVGNSIQTPPNSNQLEHCLASSKQTGPCKLRRQKTNFDLQTALRFATIDGGDQFEQQIDSRSSTPKISLRTKLDLELIDILQGNSIQSSELAPKSNNLAMIVYTRRSLGQLRAAMLSHNQLARCTHHLFLDGKLNDETSVHCATLDLDNVVEFMTEMAIISHGGSIGYTFNQKTLFFDGQDLFERDKSDLEALNPTFLLLRPYQIERLKSSVQNYLQLQLNPIINFLLVNLMCNYKKYWTKRHFGTPITDWIFCSPLRKLFGSRLRYVICNGVTDSSETKDFFAFILNTPVIELYGPPEAEICAVSAQDDWGSSCEMLRLLQRREELDHSDDDWDFLDMRLLPPTVNPNTYEVDSSRHLLMSSSVFAPSFGTRLRLEDWEDFKHTDQPYPRGRLVIGGDTVCKGYFGGDARERSRFYKDSNGINWFRSDEIARVFPNGSFELVSAMSEIIKMEDGQLISLSQIEHILRNSRFVDNICAICGTDRRFIIVLVVPNLRRLALKSQSDEDSKLSMGGIEPEPDELADVEFRREVCNDRLLCEFVGKHLTELMARSGLKDIQSHFHLVPDIWTPESELVTPSFEPKRNAIQNYYASDIESIQGLQFISLRTRLSARLHNRSGRSSPLLRKRERSTVGHRLSH